MRYYIPILIVLASTTLFFQTAQPVQAQCAGGVCGPPPATSNITTSDGAELDLMYYEGGMRSVSMNSATITGDGFVIQVTFDPVNLHSRAGISITNGDSPYDRGKGILNLNNGHGNRPLEEVADLTCLPDEHLKLWQYLQEICGELVGSEEFWNLLNLDDEEVRTSIAEDMELLRDGYYCPTTHEQLFAIQSTCGYQYRFNVMGRNYSLYGPIHLRVTASSAPGEPNPDIYMEISSRIQEDCWYIHIDPVAEVCEISWGAGDPAHSISEEEWMPAIEEFRDALNFFIDQIPMLIEGGILEPDHEIEFLLRKGLHGINSYPFEQGYIST